MEQARYPTPQVVPVTVGGVMASPLFKRGLNDGAAAALAYRSGVSPPPWPRDVERLEMISAFYYEWGRQLGAYLGDCAMQIYYLEPRTAEAFFFRCLCDGTVMP